MRNKGLGIIIFGLLFLTVGNRLFSYDWELGFKTGIMRSKAELSRDLPGIQIGTINEFHIGSFLSFFFIKNQLGFQPEIHYSIKGFNVLEADFGQEISSKYKITYIEIPLLISYKFPLKGKIKPGIVFGPYLGFARKVMEVQTAFGETEKRRLDDNLEEMDAGFVIGGNIRYRLGHFSIMLDARYNLGLANISKDIMSVSYDFTESDTIKTRSMTLSIGVSFNFNNAKEQ